MATFCRESIKIIHCSKAGSCVGNDKLHQFLHTTFATNSLVLFGSNVQFVALLKHSSQSTPVPCMETICKNSGKSHESKALIRKINHRYNKSIH